MQQKTLSTLNVKTRKKGIIMLIITLVIFISLLSYSSSDDCFNVASNIKTKNILGSFGAIISDICYQYLGISIFCFFPFLFYLSFQYIIKQQPKFIPLKTIYTIITTLCFNFILSCITGYQNIFPISLSGRIGTILNNSCQFLIIKILLVFISIIVILFYPYVIFSISRKKKIQIRQRTNNSFILCLYKIFVSIEKIIKIVFIITSIPFKIVNKIITIFRGKKNNNKKVIKKVQKTTLEEKYTYNPPSIELLNSIVQQDNIQQNKITLENNREKLSTILGDFGVRGEMIGYKTGPVVTLYEFKPNAGVKSSRIISLSDDIARTMMVNSVRIANIQGRDTLGIEVPNKNREYVCFKKLIESQEYQTSEANIPMVLGCNIFGKPIIADLTNMPHLLIAGTTGSGKSVGVNGMILSILYKLSPDECKFIMIDPKMLEFSSYDGIPHLMAPIITDAKNSVLYLKWVVQEMENRYEKMSEAGVRNITGYNNKIKLLKQKTTSKDDEILNLKPMCYIIVVIDEMADLMIVAGKEIEVLIQRLSQMARAAGIHLIMATQRPSVDVITGVIKSNFPTRISYQVTSKIDSRTILGEQGAEQLLGKGDMLFMFGGTKTLRVHGPMITDEEVENVVKYLKNNNNKPEYITLPTPEDMNYETGYLTNYFDNENDNLLFEQAKKIVITENKTSISYLQRKLRIGYNKAANFIEKMEEEGILSPPDQTGRRFLIKENNN